MNNLQLRTRLLTLIDKEQSPPFSFAELDGYLNAAAEELTKEKFADYPFNERTRNDLAPLILQSIFQAPVPPFIGAPVYNISSAILQKPGLSTVNIDVNSVASAAGFPNQFLFLLGVGGLWKNICAAGVDRSLQARRINIDEIGFITEDPFNKPDDDQPVYYIAQDMGIGARTVVVISRSNPIRLYVHWVKKHQVIDSVNSPALSTDLPDNTHEEIVSIAARKIMAAIESPVYNAQAVESIVTKGT